MRFAARGFPTADAAARTDVPVSCRTRTWIATALALFLVFLLPACVSSAWTRNWIEQGQPANTGGNTNEEREEREHVEEEARLHASRIDIDRPPVEVELVQPPLRHAHSATVAFASVAPKLHPSRFSERRLN